MSFDNSMSSATDSISVALGFNLSERGIFIYFLEILQKYLLPYIFGLIILKSLTQKNMLDTAKGLTNELYVSALSN